MKKLILSAVVITAAVFTSCEKKEILDKKLGLIEEASLQEGIVFVHSTDYERRVAESLTVSQEHGAYNSGAIEYIENGLITSRIDFSKDNLATKTCGKDVSKVDLKKGKGEKSDYEKVIVEPLVKSEDCKYIVAGIVEFLKGGKWVATIDFGDGTCDDIATKTTKEGTFTFNLADMK